MPVLYLIVVHGVVVDWTRDVDEATATAIRLTAGLYPVPDSDAVRDVLAAPDRYVTLRNVRRRILQS